ncbi:hypothetical protein K2173_022539 [Erythroxylum novogranatense]|uniref:Uncharacterized protein n=1 Tax=Erythroxylum novogranatense TaxID=1862640 RepID=A0AAV8TI23_9ROSI|nr:hypothetical protein K2173_022539 [Erythroxylum novogranatense]
MEGSSHFQSPPLPENVTRIQNSSKAVTVIVDSQSANNQLKPGKHYLSRDCYVVSSSSLELSHSSLCDNSDLKPKTLLSGDFKPESQSEEYGFLFERPCLEFDRKRVFKVFIQRVQEYSPYSSRQELKEGNNDNSNIHQRRGLAGLSLLQLHHSFSLETCSFSILASRDWLIDLSVESL